MAHDQTIHEVITADMYRFNGGSYENTGVRMNHRQSTRIIALFVTLMGVGAQSLQAFLNIPLSIAALVPLFGQAGAKAGVKQTLNNVDGVVRYVWFFLYGVGIFFLLFLTISAIRAIKRAKKRRRFTNVARLLQQLQADVVFLKEKNALDKLQLKEIEISKHNAIEQLQKQIVHPFFKKRMGAHVHTRMHEALDLMNKGKISKESEPIFIEQWLKTIDLLQR